MPGDRGSEAARPEGMRKVKAVLLAGDAPPPLDIGVSMSASVLEHKKRDGKASDDRYCFWSMTKVPERVRAGSKLWVASLGSWIGYFVIHAAVRGEVRFHSETWTSSSMDILARPRPPFRGFTYKVPGAN